jgi:regulatory protein YycI of two-component signal transduction system YycFG
LDWNKTKTIFIIVFSILNVFLYSLFLNKHTDAQNVQILGESSIEEALRLDNITYPELPVYKKESFFVSAKIVTFTPDQVDLLENQIVTESLEGTLLESVLEAPFSIRNAKGDYSFPEFLLKYVLNGSDYVLWEVNEEERQALFFQKVNENPIYFNKNGMLTVHWDEDSKVTNYEQRMFGEFESFNPKKLLIPIEAINALVTKGHLKPDSTVLGMALGYSTLVQLKTQVFAPTWHVRVELRDGEIEDYFINAIDGKIIEFQRELIEPIEHDIE